MSNHDNQSLETRHQNLTQKRVELQSYKVQIEAELAARKRELKKLMKQARESGFDPDNLKEDIRRKEQVLALKLDAYEADLTAAEQTIRPMLQEIQSNGHG
jgi:uncharacterized protein (UPF0335 family)